MGWLSDIGNAAASVASAVGNAVEDAVDAVVDTVEDAVDAVVDTVQDGISAATDWLCKNKPGGRVLGQAACWAGNILGGLVDGALQGFQDILHDAFDVVRDVGGLAGSLLRLDLPGFLKGLGTLALDLLDLAIDAGRFVLGGYLVGGVVSKFRRSELMDFVETLVDQRFGDDPERRADVRRKIGLEDGRFGLRLPAQHRVFTMDSSDVPLWRMHEDGVIDLYAMAGLLSFDSFSLGAAHPNTVVTSVGSDGADNLWPVSRWTIAKYLESDGKEKRLRVYAMSRRVVAQNLDTASRKLDEIGVILEWNDGENFSWFRDYTRQDIKDIEGVLLPNGELRFSVERLYDLNSNDMETLLEQDEYNRPRGVNCELVALAAFKLDRDGRVGGRNIWQCGDFPADCSNPGRTDRCCITVQRNRSSGVIYRDVYPTDLRQYILAHEIGHYVGLCHCDHGPESIMWTPPWRDPDAIYGDLGLLSYYWESEPHFSLEDGKNAWRFVIDQLASCLTGEPEVPPIITLERARPSSLHSCAVVREPELV